MPACEVLELMAAVGNAEFAERPCVAEAVLKRRVGTMFISLGVCDAPRRSRSEYGVDARRLERPGPTAVGCVLVPPGDTRPVAGTWLDCHASSKEGRVISGIGKVVVPVDDQERAKEFWTQRMGFKLRRDDPTATSAGLEVSLPTGAGARPGARAQAASRGARCSTSCRIRRCSSTALTSGPPIAC